MQVEPVRIAIVGSNRATSSRLLLDHPPDNASVQVIITNKPKAPIVELAARYGIPVEIIHTARRQPHEYEEQLVRALHSHNVNLIHLVGFDRIVPKGAIEAVDGRVTNLHPSLLPTHSGPSMFDLAVHQAVLNARDAQTGCTLHIATDQLDRGPILDKRVIDVLSTDDVHSLKARVQAQEGPLLLDITKAFAQGRVHLQKTNGRVTKAWIDPT